MIPLDIPFAGPFSRCGKIAIINMKTHIVLLDYDNGTFRKFDSIDDLKNYAETISKMLEHVKDDDNKPKTKEKHIPRGC